MLVVRKTKAKGRGVFWDGPNIGAGTLIESSPVLVLSAKEAMGPKLQWYVYEWERKQFALALGFGSLFNHAIVPKLRYVFDYRSQRIRYYTNYATGKGEELTINYNGEAGDRSPVGFRVQK